MAGRADRKGWQNRGGMICTYCRNTGWEWVKDAFGDAEQAHCIWCNSHKMEVNMTKKLPTPFCQDDLALEVTRLEKRIIAKGYHSPEVMFHVPGYSGAKALLLVSGYPDAKFHGSKVADYIRDESDGPDIDIGALIERADAYLDALKSPTDIRADQFRANLGRLIDEAKDIGVDVATVEAVVNPLVELMVSLSENIIEHQPIAAE
jgi:hypothetical protein